MKQEYKGLLKQIFHDKLHMNYESDYYSLRYEYVNEEEHSVGLRLDTKLLDKPLRPSF